MANANITLQIKIPRFKKYGFTKKLIDELLNIARDDIRDHTPVRTGALKNSVSKRQNGSGGEVFFRGKRNNEVAGYLIRGTRRHWIFPRRAGGVLAWQGRSGKWFYSKGHQVRGIKRGYYDFKLSSKALTEIKNKIQFQKDNSRIK